MKGFLTIILFIFSIHSWAQSDNAIQAIVQMGHSKPVSCADFSSDGRFVATGSLDNSIILWDFKSGKQIKSFDYHLKSVTAISFSKDNTKILSASNDNSIRLIDIHTGESLLKLTLPKGDLSNAYFSDDNRHIIGLNKRNEFAVWSTADGQLIGQYGKDYSAHSKMRLISPDGKKVLSKHNYNTVYCLTLGTNDTLFSMNFDKAYEMNFSPDGQSILIGSAKLFAQVFDAETGKLLEDLKSDSEKSCDGCNTVSRFSPSGQYIFTMSNKLDGVLWDTKSGKQVKKIGNIEKRPSNIAFSQDEKYLLLSFDKQLVVYSVKTGREVINQTNDWLSYYDIQFSQSGHQFVLPGKFNTAEVWDAEKARPIKIFKGYQNQQKADGLRYNYTNWVDQKILQYISYKNNISISKDNRHVAIGKVDSSVVIFDLLTGRRQKVLNEQGKAILCHDYSPDGKWFATAGGDRIIRVYDTDNYELKFMMSGHRDLIFDLRFNETGNEIVSGSWDGTIKVWDFENERQKQTIDLENVSPYLVRYSPNDLYILSGDLYQNVQFWEFDSKQNFRSLIGHTNTISGIEFSPDKTTMVTSSWDGKVKVWHVLTGMLLAKFKSGSPVYSVIYGHVSNEIIAGDGNRTIRIWDTETGEIKSILKGHTSAVTDLKLTSNGKYLISRGANGEIKVWDFQTKIELYTYLQINSEDWLVKNPQGYFDGSKAALSLVNYVSGLEVISITSLFDKYYTPNLTSIIMSGEKLNDSGEQLNTLIKDRPELAFDVPDLKVRAGEWQTDTVIMSKTEIISIDISILENGKNVNEIRLYNNGKLIEKESSEVVFRSIDQFKRNFNINLIDGLNLITAIAVADNDVESEPISLSVTFDGEAAKTDLFIFSIGINTYKNSNYNLSYAVKDANDFSGSLVKGGKTLFNHVFEYKLIDAKANKNEIKLVFDELAQKIGPEDVFVFYYAGHGVMTVKTESKPSDFYIVTHDVVNFYGDDVENKGLSASLLMEYSKLITAQKQLFILDACHSGGALNSLVKTRGDGREKALAQLARNTGTFFLTASQDIQYANEAGDLKHGLFTYALLEVLAGENYGTSLDGKITINEMKAYVEERVPELSEKYHGSSQYPTSYSFGQDFPIVILK